jgi:glycosyltransferase involved in cell wall biosynthesis
VSVPMVDSFDEKKVGKVTGLLMFKNEEANIPIFMENLLPFVDEILGYDDNSTDKSASLFLRKGGKLIDFKPTSAWANGGENQIRQALLQEGRRRGGKFFVVLDSDESFNAFFQQSFTTYLQMMNPGQSMRLKWINLWDSQDRFCSSNSIWQPNYKEFVFRDHSDLTYGTGTIHSFGRVAKGPNNDGFLDIPEDDGVVLHSQFVNWDKLQLKQAWYRLQEWLYTTQSMYAINKKYRITLNKYVETLPLPPHWRPISDFQNSEIIELVENDWHLTEIRKIIDEHGMEKLEKLDIWNGEVMSKIWREYSRKTPKPSHWMGIKEFIGFCLWYLKKLGKLN